MAGDSLAARLFAAARDAQRIEAELSDALEDMGVPFDDIGWDDYDDSIELRGVSPDYRLPADAQRFLHAAGFLKVYVNHVGGWETHYSYRPDGPFTESPGWRVSHPGKRDDPHGSIWVEAVVEGWPAKWFETGYVIVKPSPHPPADSHE